MFQKGLFQITKRKFTKIEQQITKLTQFQTLNGVNFVLFDFGKPPFGNPKQALPKDGSFIILKFRKGERKPVTELTAVKRDELQI